MLITWSPVLMTWTKAMIEALRKVLKRMHYPLEVMLVCVRWYVAYPLSLRDIEEMMAERGVFVDHATVRRWAIKILPVLSAVLRGRKRPVGKSWRMDETYIKVAGQWKYLYRAVDRDDDAKLTERSACQLHLSRQAGSVPELCLLARAGRSMAYRPGAMKQPDVGIKRFQ